MHTNDDRDAWERRAIKELTRLEQEPEPVGEPAEPACNAWDEALVRAAERAGIELSHSE